jgi:sterol desaturase/sphingolipid hydroxylase (fatty acid hydroxylase superfamily)
MEGWLAHEATLRYYALIVAFGVVAVAEAWRPRRRPLPAVRGRWSINVGLTVLLSAAAAFVFPVLSVGMAVAAQRASFGVLNAFNAPAWLEAFVAFLALDAGRYGVHALLHRSPWLWRLHRVHHSDTDYDCTTALRFHPLEALVTIGLQIALVALLGAPPLIVLAYELVSGIVSLFSHGNVRLGERVDVVLRLLVVTPDMHRIHHSAVVPESNANFGGVLPWWDWLFGTYRAHPLAGHEAMTIGLADIRDARTEHLGWLLLSPFARRFVASD